MRATVPGVGLRQQCLCARDGSGSPREPRLMSPVLLMSPFVADAIGSRSRCYAVELWELAQKEVAGQVDIGSTAQGVLQQLGMLSSLETKSAFIFPVSLGACKVT